MVGILFFAAYVLDQTEESVGILPFFAVATTHDIHERTPLKGRAAQVNHHHHRIAPHHGPALLLLLELSYYSLAPTATDRASRLGQVLRPKRQALYRYSL